MTDWNAAFLLWVRGPGFLLASAFFLAGVTLRLFEIVAMGRAQEFAPAREGGGVSPARLLVSRFLVPRGMLPRAPVVYAAGYLFHVSFLLVLFFATPHTTLLQSLFGVSLPSLPTAAADGLAVAAMVALAALLASRLLEPVRRFLAEGGDYLAWTLSFLPLATGFAAFHHLVQPYPLMLGLHVLSAEVLLAALPFTRLAHAFTLFLARWYTGRHFGQKGVAA